MSESWIDRSWKDVIKENLDDALSFFMPGLAAERDYTAKPGAADPEHPAIGGKSNKGQRTSDLCVSLPLKGDAVSRALFLVEQQHEEDKTLPRRIFQSFYRASDEYDVPVTALAIYTGKTPPVDTYISKWQGTSIYFKYNIYSVEEADAEALKRDGRNFALAVLTAKRMLEAGGRARERGEYSLEILDLIKKRNLDADKAWSFQKFVYRLLQIDKDDIDPKVKEVWGMQFRPIDEVVRDIHIRDAREAGIAEGQKEGIKKGIEKGIEKGKFEVARSMLADGFPAEAVRKYTGLDESSILSLRY
jgi:predicted transposase YdaD